MRHRSHARHGALWTPTALPIREEAFPYVVSHGQGYSRFEHVSHGISLALLQYVPPDDPIKISRLTIQNQSGRSRRLSITAYVEWVLGASRTASAPFVVSPSLRIGDPEDEDGARLRVLDPDLASVRFDRESTKGEPEPASTPARLQAARLELTA